MKLAPRPQPALLAALLLLASAAPAGAVGQPPGRRQAASAPALSLVEFHAGQPGAGPKNYQVTTLRALPHEGMPWTQGLEFLEEEGNLVETSGNFPSGVGSFVRVIDPSTGKTVRKVTQGLGAPIFLEGITRMGNRWFASTYDNKVALEFDGDFNMVKSHAYPTEGWGLTRSVDGESFLATNGSEYILSLDAETFQLQSAMAATCLGKLVGGINELEMVDDFLGGGPALLGNVMNTRVVVVLDPATAACKGAFHLNGLGDPDSDEAFGRHVANGIAYDKGKGTFWVTGKNWASMFEISVTEGESEPGAQDDAVVRRTGQWSEALDLLRTYLR